MSVSEHCVHALSGETLSIDDLGDVYTKLYDARAKWFDIGLAFNVNHGTLEAIRSDHCESGDCLRETLAYRIQSGGPLTWADLCSCLQHPTIGRSDLAAKIDQREPSFANDVDPIKDMSATGNPPESSLDSISTEG